MPVKKKAYTPANKKTKDKSFAITSFVCGALFWVPLFNAVLGVLALVFGILAIRRVRENPSRYGGQGLALAGIVLGCIALIFGAVWVFLRLFYPEMLLL